jgi:hypothetical protein
VSKKIELNEENTINYKKLFQEASEHIKFLERYLKWLSISIIKPWWNKSFTRRRLETITTPDR